MTTVAPGQINSSFPLGLLERHVIGKTLGTQTPVSAAPASSEATPTITSPGTQAIRSSTPNVVANLTSNVLTSEDERRRRAAATNGRGARTALGV